MPHKQDKTLLKTLQIELVKYQNHLIKHNEKIVIIFEGRDAAGKDGTIKRITKHLSPRETRIVALGKPSDKEQKSWYFQRYTEYLPAESELVLFNRSWYNRAGVEKVMGFCSDDEYEEFLETVTHYENLLISSGIKLFKYYLDITKDEQKKRLHEREIDPLKQWKISPIDQCAQDYWHAYSQARNAMFNKTHHLQAPWRIVNANDKYLTRINVIKDMLFNVAYAGKDQDLVQPDTSIVFEYHPDHLIANIAK